MIKAYIKGEQRNWDQHLACLAAAYRVSKPDTTGFTPNFLMLGRAVRLPGEVALPPDSDTRSNAEYVEELRERLHLAHEVVRAHLKAVTCKQKDRYDLKSYQTMYHPGDLVWYLKETTQEGVCPKLQDIYMGPYVILQKYSTTDYLIQKDESGRQTVVHHDKLKIYQGTSRPTWARAAVKNYGGRK